MYKLTLFILAALFAVTLAAGQYYVPRAYYTIDAEGHESAHVPLRRLRRSLPPPYPYGANANANANAHAEANGGGSANANARADASARAGSWGGQGGWAQPGGSYGSASPNALSAGMTRRQSGPVLGGRSVSATSNIGLDSSGNGYYDQSVSALN